MSTVGIDRSILITGASSGIGLASATLLKSRGWRVLATVRRPEDLAKLEALGCEALPLELADPASIASCATAALDRTDGRLFALFNNAAYGQPGAVEDLTVDVLKAQFEVNLFAWHDLTRRILPAMRKTGRGRIVQCSSVLGFISPPYRGAYNASKHALEALSDAMRFELQGSGVTVSIIEPGPIATQFVPNAIEAFRRNVGLRRLGARGRVSEAARSDAGRGPQARQAAARGRGGKACSCGRERAAQGSLPRHHTDASGRHRQACVASVAHGPAGQGRLTAILIKRSLANSWPISLSYLVRAPWT